MDVRTDAAVPGGLPQDGPHWQQQELPPLRLVVQPGGVAMPVTQAEVVVGRHSQADVRLPLPDVSRRHCRIVYSGGKWHIFDMDSLNGVFVNGARIKHARLEHRDVISIGGFALQVDMRSTTPTVALPMTAGRSDGDPIQAVAGVLAAGERRNAA
jgi:pSer/pThr/pTyr-binding forkhead associated (FHA) protein